MKKIVIIVLALAVVVGFAIWRFGPKVSPNIQTGPVTLTFWGLWEDEALIKPLIEEYRKVSPDTTINYVRQSSVNYRTRVQTQVRAGVGPDVFMIHNTWLPMFIGDLAPSSMSLTDYQSTFYPVAVDSFVKDNQILVSPMEVDGLALYYNEEILIAAGVVPPKNWQEFIEGAVKMTVKDSSGQIRTSGAAMGTSGNVDHWSDLIGLLLLQQPNINFNALASPAAAEVLRFYTGFVIDPRKKTWDTNLPSSTDMFASGRLAYYFAPSWRAHELRVQNPNLRFKTVAVPQLPGKNVGWASFWGYGVSSRSQSSSEAWKFINFLTSAQAEKLAYANASQIRLFGQPYSRVDLGPELVADPIVGAFVSQGLFYKTWYLASNTYDLGINDEMIKYFEDGINTTLQGTDPQIALQTIDQGVKQVLQKYTQPQVVIPTR